MLESKLVDGDVNGVPGMTLTDFHHLDRSKVREGGFSSCDPGVDREMLGRLFRQEREPVGSLEVFRGGVM